MYVLLGKIFCGTWYFKVDRYLRVQDVVRHFVPPWNAEHACTVKGQKLTQVLLPHEHVQQG